MIDGLVTHSYAVQMINAVGTPIILAVLVGVPILLVIDWLTKNAAGRG